MHRLRTLAYDDLGTILMVASGPTPPSDGDWARWVELIRHRHARGGGDVRILIWSGEGAPNAAQRRELAGLAKETAARFAVVTDSHAAKLVLRAAQWAGVLDIRGFNPDQLFDACAFLDAPEGERGDIARRLKKLSDAAHGRG